MIFGIGKDREERRRLMEAAEKKLKDDPKLAAKFKAHVIAASRAALNGSVPPDLAPPEPKADTCPT